MSKSEKSLEKLKFLLTVFTLEEIARLIAGMTDEEIDHLIKRLKQYGLRG